MFAHDLKPLDILNYLLKMLMMSHFCALGILEHQLNYIDMTHVIHWARENTRRMATANKTCVSGKN